MATGIISASARDRYGPFRLAILPIGAYEPRWFMGDQHMNPAEAVRAFQTCGAELALGHHYGTFQLTDEAFDAPEQALETARIDADISPEQFRLLKPGQVWEVAARDRSALNLARSDPGSRLLPRPG